MRLSRVLIAGAAVAAVGIATSAFTAGNTVEEDTIAGYGSAEVSGVEATNIQYVQDPDDPSKLASVVFTVDKDTRDSLSTLTFYKLDDDDTGPHVEETLTAPSDCESTTGPDLITCELTTPLLLAAFDKVGLTVVSQ
jgi:hypothetical protein